MDTAGREIVLSYLMLSFLKKNKGAVLVLFLVVGTLFPIYAHAGLSEEIAGAIFKVMVKALTWIGSGLLSITSYVFEWVTSDSFMDWNYTGFGGGTPNPVVQEGWKLTRDLSNMVIAIYLAFIGLATALEIKDYEAKKALPKVIAVALFINFTPVLCGAIIDASNIVTHFFLGSFSGAQVFNEQIQIHTDQVIAEIDGSGLKLSTYFGFVLQAIMLTAFAGIAALVYGLFAFLFFARYAALWILVIISPFVAIAYMIPKMQSVWNQWWKEFLNWCFIGVTGSFFLYLSGMLLQQIQSADVVTGAAPSGAGLTGGLSVFLKQIVPYALPLVFLIFGLQKSLESSAMGADKVIDFAKKAEGKVNIGGRLKSRAKAIGEGVGRGVKERTIDRVATSETVRNIAGRLSGGLEIGDMSW